MQAAPFANLFEAYCATALTHIADDVRLDAIGTLALWTHRFPDQMYRLRDKVMMARQHTLRPLRRAPRADRAPVPARNGSGVRPPSSWYHCS